MSDYSKSALEILRNPRATMQWYIIPLFVLVMYLVSDQIHRKNWNVLLGGAALWLTDLFNEIWNSIVFHATGFAPVWGTPMGVGNTSLLILIGYNIEISFMFLMLGMSACLALPEDPKKKILGINNRALLAVGMSIFCVVIECFLNYSGILTWEYSWWSIQFPWILFLIGYLPFFVMAYVVHDMKSRKKQIITVGSMAAFDLLLLVIFGSIGWM